MYFIASLKAHVPYIDDMVEDDVKVQIDKYIHDEFQCAFDVLDVPITEDEIDTCNSPLRMW